MRQTLGWTDSDAVVRADGESQALRRALARPGLRALVFKEAGALSFDAPEASALVSFRPVLDDARAQQALGRILRIPDSVRRRLAAGPPLPDDVRSLLSTAWVCVPDAGIQAGYVQAARALNALEETFDIPVQDQPLVLRTPPASPAAASPASPATTSSAHPADLGPLFGGADDRPAPFPAVAIARTDTLKAAYPNFDTLRAHAADLGLRLHPRRRATAETPTHPPAVLPSERAADLALLQTVDDAILWQALTPGPGDLAALLPQAKGLIEAQVVQDALRLDHPGDVPVRLSQFLKIEDPIALAFAAETCLRRRFPHLEAGLTDRLRTRLRQHPDAQAIGLSPRPYAPSRQPPCRPDPRPPRRPRQDHLRLPSRYPCLSRPRQPSYPVSRSLWHRHACPWDPHRLACARSPRINPRRRRPNNARHHGRGLRPQRPRARLRRPRRGPLPR